MKKSSKFSQEIIENKMLEDIQIKIKNDSKRTNELSRQFENVIIKFANDVDNYYSNHSADENISYHEEKIIAELNNKKLLSILNQKDYISLFHDYVLCYFDTCIFLRNEMISKKNATLFYSYMFTLVHYLELVIKYLCVSDVQGFLKIEVNHNIIKLYESKKEQILSLGLDIKYYEKLIELLNEFRNITKTDDFAMAFKYPVFKDLKTQIISKEIFEIGIDKIKKIADRHKVLLYITLDIYFLGKCSNYRDLIEITKANQEKWEKLINDISNEQ